jgi:hypothetical protein
MLLVRHAFQKAAEKMTVTTLEKLSVNITPYVYDYTTKSCRQQAEVIQNHEIENVRYIGQGEAPHSEYKRLKLGGGHVYDCSSI